MFNTLLKNCDTDSKWGQKTIEYLIYLSVVLVPLIFLPNINSVFSFPKLYVFRILTLIIIFIWGFRLLLNKEIEFKWTPFLWFLIGYCGISLINTIFTVNILTSLFGNYGYFTGFFTMLNLVLWAYIVMCEINTFEKIKKLLLYSVITATIIAIYGIFQSQNWFVNVFSWSQDPTDRVFSTIGHSNHTAAYLAMNVMILIGIIRNSKFGWGKILFWISAILMILTIILTASRGGIFALFAGLVCWIIYGLLKRNFVHEIKKYLKIILTVVVILILGIVTFRDQIAGIEIIKRTTETFDFMSKGNIPDRVSWWLSSLEMVKDNPVLGHGLSTFRDTYNKYRRIDYKLPDDIQDGITPEAAHMEYLNIWATQGTLGLAVYLTMIVGMFVYGRKFIKMEKQGENRVVIFSLMMGLVVYLVQVIFSFGVIATLFMFFTFIGLIFAPYMDKKQVKVPAYARAFGLILSVLILGFGFFFSINNLIAEYHFKQADVFASKRDYPKAIESYKQTIKYVPYEYEYYQNYADFLFNLAVMMPDSSQPDYLKDALDIYEKAINLNNNFPSVHVNKALAASRLADLNRNRPEEFEKYKNSALEETKKAVEIGINNPLYLYKYGQMLMFFGDKASAVKQFEEVLKIRNPYKDTAELIEQNL